MEATVSILDNEYGNSVVQCMIELPEKDPITKNDFMIFREDMTIIPSKHVDKWGLYVEQSKAINTLFDRICMNIIRFEKYGIKGE